LANKQATLTSIETSRLRLIPLQERQLDLCLRDLSAFELDLGLPFARELIDANVLRALGMKLKKMSLADPSTHEWYTYWLIVIKDEAIGAGLIGFKGFPDEQGSTEIGYGIAPRFQNQGYMTEAVRSLVDWAFAHPICKTVTATTVKNSASNRLLEKLGAQLVEQNDNSFSWSISRV
jgi:RimJ/RimL family protein N-acetyltransferase